MKLKNKRCGGTTGCGCGQVGPSVPCCTGIAIPGTLYASDPNGSWPLAFHTQAQANAQWTWPAPWLWDGVPASGAWIGGYSVDRTIARQDVYSDADPFTCKELISGTTGIRYILYCHTYPSFHWKMAAFTRYCTGSGPYGDQPTIYNGRISSWDYHSTVPNTYTDAQIPKTSNCSPPLWTWDWAMTDASRPEWKNFTAQIYGYIPNAGDTRLTVPVSVSP